MNPEQYKKGLEELKNDLVVIVLEAPFIRSQEIMGLSLNRIFNKGKATDGSQIGQYDDTKKQTFLTEKALPSLTKKQQKKLEKTGKSLTYKELRESKGLQTDYVDLQFTGALFENINTGRTEDGAIIGHTNIERAKIAGYLENKYKKPIFPPSEEEILAAQELMTQYVTEQYLESIKRIFNGK